MGNSHVILGKVSDIGHPGREATAVWIKDGLIKAVGRDEVVSRARSQGAEIHDRGDAYISPGFIDPHVHLEAYAEACATHLDLRFPGVTTVRDVLTVLRKATQVGAGWIIGQANLFWNHKLEEGRYPTLQELDTVSTERPIAIRAGGHVSILNTKAIELSGLESYADEHGMMGRAVIERDEFGNMTGLIAELDAVLPTDELDDASFEDALKATIKHDFTRHGVTTIGEIHESQRGARTFKELEHQDNLPLRVFQHFWTPGAFQLENLDDYLDADSDFRGLVRPSAVKIFADGGFSARNAAVLNPYTTATSNTASSTGDLNLTAKDIMEMLSFCDERGLQLAVHTNGERAQHMVLDAAAAWSEQHPAPRIRKGLLRLEHAGNLMTSDTTLRRLQHSAAIMVTQPTFIYTFSGLLPSILGCQAARGRHPYRRLLDVGLEPAASSDIHMGAEPNQMNPFFGMWCATSRKTFTDEPLETSQTITVREAMAMYTLYSARALGAGHSLGSITPGKMADLAICSQDPISTEPENLPGISVEEVWINGRVVPASRQ